MKYGLYEKLINKSLSAELKSIDSLIQTENLDKSESPKIISKYISEIIEQKLCEMKDDGDELNAQVEFANSIIEMISDDSGDEIHDQNQKLLAVINKKNSIYALNEKVKIARPETSIVTSSLFTGAVHEPTMMSELKKEIVSSNKIDMIVSFIKWSGLRQIIEELREFTQKGGKLRIITTSYMGATDVKAIDELNKLENTEISISYNTKTTRLHAKSYIFYRDTGYSTAYIGSSNLSNAAISSGLEWNVKITCADQKETFKKVEATFESYLNSVEFELYNDTFKDKLKKAISAERIGVENEKYKFEFDITPYNYQQEILDKLSVERDIKGRFKNLVVAATGTGKTVISAFDYKNYTDKNPSAKLLFIAHREEILKQSVDCFRGILKDANFGDLFVGNNKPESLNYLFLSVQTFHSQKLWESIDPNFYDFIVVDEIHHASAKTYQTIFSHFIPKRLLGLTATPERADGKSILEYFENRIAAEIRLPEAIERKLLCPFQYFGVSDTVDLSELKWSVGGYQKNELTNVYVLNYEVAMKRAKHIIRSLDKYVTDIDDVSGIGFCVSVEHATFMSNFFNENGIASEVLTGKSDKELREYAKVRLAKKEIKFIFTVDIYNEGVDIPEINTVLFLRPTESLTVFLQQLGRGLRLHKKKECLTVLDFVGQANKKYNFTEKFSALTDGADVKKEVENGFISVPKGCYIHLEKKAKEYILRNIKTDFNTKAGLISRLATFKEDTGLELTYSNFLSYYKIRPMTMYKRGSFSSLCMQAKLVSNYKENEVIEKAFARLFVIDSVKMIRFLLKLLDNLDMPLTNEEKIMLNMFGYTIYLKNESDIGSYIENLRELGKSECLYNEISELLRFNLDNIQIIQKSVDVPYDCPLDIYATYSRDQILVGLGFDKPDTVREGVKYLKDIKTDVLFVTLNKSDKDYSPTTMYDDYSINETMFHWQSQSGTSEASNTGRRYINHRKVNSKIMLFVRENKKNEIGATPYTFLGTVNYMMHTGSKPMSITWRMDEKIPAKYLKKTNKMVVG